MTPLSCAKPSLKMRRLFCCEKCLLSFATALKIQVKTDEDKTNFNRNNFSKSKNGPDSCLLLFATTTEKGSF